MKVSLFSSESQASCSTSSSLPENFLLAPSHEPSSTLFFTLPDSAQPTTRDAIVALGTFISTFALIRNYYLGQEERLSAAINAESSTTREFVKQQGRETQNFMEQAGERVAATVINTVEKQESETRKILHEAGQEVFHAVQATHNEVHEVKIQLDRMQKENADLAKMLFEMHKENQSILAHQKQLGTSSNTPNNPTTPLLEPSQTTSNSERVESSNTTEPATESLNTLQNQSPVTAEPQKLRDVQNPAVNINSPLPTPEQEVSFKGRLGDYVSAIGSFFWRNNQTPA